MKRINIRLRRAAMQQHRLHEEFCARMDKLYTLNAGRMESGYYWIGCVENYDKLPKMPRPKTVAWCRGDAQVYLFSDKRWIGLTLDKNSEFKIASIDGKKLDDDDPLRLVNL